MTRQAFSMTPAGRCKNSKTTRFFARLSSSARSILDAISINGCVKARVTGRSIRMTFNVSVT